MSTQQVRITASPDQADILLAELGEIGFDIFEDSDTGLIAYCQTDLFDLVVFKDLISRYQFLGPIQYEIQEIQKQNWNAVWETNYDPIRIADLVFIRANFHPSEPGYQIEIVINPKMSFGTGHHETTFQMSQALFDLNLTGKSVLDAGTGTGILAFVAKKLGATFVRGFDIDEWSVENSIENASLNACEEVEFGRGTILDESARMYDVLLANINRNILLDEMDEYAGRIVSGGDLLLSGFYTEDIPMLVERAEALGLNYVSQSEKNRWACLRFKKI
ncbi:MAG: Ribosomal protein methyltransferase [Bacteroidota bacterium]|jgi:ribosomal protein L11 methyltransferase